MELVTSDKTGIVVLLFLFGNYLYKVRPQTFVYRTTLWLCRYEDSSGCFNNVYETRIVVRGP